MIKKLDCVERIIINTFKSLGLLLLYICWSLIFVIIFKIFGFNTKNLSDMNKLIITFIADITFLMVIFFIYHKKIIGDFKKYFDKDCVRDNIGESLKYWGIGLMIMIISNVIIIFVTKGKIADNEEAVRNLIKISPIIMAFEVSIYAPIVEELIFRHSIKNITDNKYIYPLLSGLIFGGLHVIGSTDSVSFLYLIPYSSLGIMFAMLYRKTDNIFSSIFVHFLHNTIILLMLVGRL